MVELKKRIRGEITNSCVEMFIIWQKNATLWNFSGVFLSDLCPQFVYSSTNIMFFFITLIHNCNTTSVVIIVDSSFFTLFVLGQGFLLRCILSILKFKILKQNATIFNQQVDEESKNMLGKKIYIRSIVKSPLCSLGEVHVKKKYLVGDLKAHRGE